MRCLNLKNAGVDEFVEEASLFDRFSTCGVEGHKEGEGVKEGERVTAVANKEGSGADGGGNGVIEGRRRSQSS